MDSELAERWADALESGKYKQIFGSLQRTETTMCAIGVLSAIKGYHTKTPYAFRTMLCTPPVEVLSFDDRQRFVRLNDGLKLSFAQIADVIRETYCAEAQEMEELYALV